MKTIKSASLIFPLNRVPFKYLRLREAVGNICDERGILKWRIREILNNILE